jgi:hypothetical protein
LKIFLPFIWMLLEFSLRENVIPYCTYVEAHMQM